MLGLSIFELSIVGVIIIVFDHGSIRNCRSDF